MWSLSFKVRSCSAMHAAVGFVLQISFVALAQALLGDISFHDCNFCQLKLSFAYITKVGVNMHSHSCCLFFNISYFTCSIYVIGFSCCMLMYARE